MGKFTAYKLPLKTLQPGASHFEWELGKQFFTDMEDADIRDADLHVDLDVVLKDDIYDLRFHITGTVTLLCDRCLDDLVIDVDTTYHIAVEYGDDYNDESDTLLTIPASSPSLNVAYMLRDTVALTIPMRHVHPQGKCNRAMSAVLKRHRAQGGDDADGVDDACGDDAPDGDTASDPRWDALRDLPDSDS